MKRALFAAALLLLVARAGLAADKIVETATFSFGIAQPPLISSVQYFAARFHVSQITSITQAGGHLSNTSPFPFPSDLFVAIVKVSGPNGLPVGNPFNTNEVIASAVLIAPDPSADADVLASLSTTLVPGDYLVVIGSGRFGANGAGTMPHQGQSFIGSQTILSWEGTGWANDGNPRRFVVMGAVDTIHQSIIDVLSPSIASRASQTSVDNLATTIGGLATQVSVNGVSTSVLNLSASVAGLGTTVGGVATTVAGLQPSLNSANVKLDAIQSSVRGLASQASVDALSGRIGNLSNLDTAVSSRAAQASVDEILAKLRQHQDNNAQTQQLILHLEIEKALADPQTRRIVSFFLPEIVGGHIEFVRQVVSETITAAQLAGFSVVRALDDLAQGDQALALGQYRTAFGLYARAYRQLAR